MRLVLVLWAFAIALLGGIQAKEPSLNPLQVEVFISYCVA